MDKNLILINDKVITGINGTKTVNCLQMRNFAGYDFCDSGGNCDIALGVFSTSNTETETIENFEPHIFSIVKIPNEIVKNWGESDDPIIDFVLENLGLEKKSNSFFTKVKNLLNI